ncbi:uncharacterized protein EV154DRAFT_451722 [Mucor mucedo]|uniref:uncharacterized protein n=1 Tax=Mucor mucedo TaxID=29922 RepID=UPI0022204A83|nr:uncharacterized protein EV154DRAFT_451722 [Mucor mucedo]KAI7875524.1 hypothetical protein EV154DRAFT_451722 [Mucor mucedo]
MFLSTKERASKSLRRLTKAKISTPIAQVTLELPKKIIKALHDYQATSGAELSFKKGDFFHVTGREHDAQWFEACNPLSKSQGLVPVSYFQVIEKNERSLPVNRPTSSSTSSTLTSELDSGFSDLSSTTQGIGIQKKKHQQVYGVVMYDFKAERPDELEATAGEAIVVIAQSNHEWFVAKPIGRLGGPGLIPVSFVQVRDAQTGELIDHIEQSNPVPGVEDWKKMTLSYEASSIPLGVFEKTASVASSSSATPVAVTPKSTRLSDSSTESMLELVTFASIDSFILEGDQYWFVIYARVHGGAHRILYRLYEDFYDFQINLLQMFPMEAGKEERERILPFMPGPLENVTDEITQERQVDLDRYCKDLLKLPGYLAESELVQRQLFGIHEGDIELDYDPRVSHSHQSQQSQGGGGGGGQQQNQIKIKIVHKDDMFAMKVPTDCTLDMLRQKVVERIGMQVTMQYKNEATGENEPLEGELDMEEAFVQAIQRGKLTVTATAQ